MHLKPTNIERNEPNQWELPSHGREQSCGLQKRSPEFSLLEFSCDLHAIGSATKLLSSKVRPKVCEFLTFRIYVSRHRGRFLGLGEATIAYRLSLEVGSAPAASTIWKILVRYGLVIALPKKRPRSFCTRFEARIWMLIHEKESRIVTTSDELLKELTFDAEKNYQPQ